MMIDGGIDALFYFILLVVIIALQQQVGSKKCVFGPYYERGTSSTRSGSIVVKGNLKPALCLPVVGWV